MRPEAFAVVLRDLLRKEDRPDITRVQTHDEAGISREAAGIQVDMADQPALYVAIVALTPPDA
jgi:hypothetical protein